MGAKNKKRNPKRTIAGSALMFSPPLSLLYRRVLKLCNLARGGRGPRLGDTEPQVLCVCDIPEIDAPGPWAISALDCPQIDRSLGAHENYRDTRQRVRRDAWNGDAGVRGAHFCFFQSVIKPEQVDTRWRFYRSITTSNQKNRTRKTTSLTEGV